MKIETNSSRNAEKLFQLVGPELQEIDARLKEEAISSLKLVDEMNRYLHGSGGKRLRPALLLLVSKMCGVNGDSPLKLGVVVELIHVATLVHDDIIDNSDTRRGRPSANAKWGSEVTVLFGDWLYMTAFWIALRERNFEILDILIDLTRRMVEGELLQLEANYNLSQEVDDYLRICWHKTAHLFSGCARLGGVMAGSKPELKKTLADYGKALGMAFQVTDDLLDYTADEVVVGKPVLKDLQEGNVTLPVIELMKSASLKQQHFLRQVVETRQFSDENKKRIIDLVNDYGCIDKSKKLARRFTEEARNSLNGFPDSEYKQALLDLPELVLNRSK